ncbi:hypothetical protein D3C83_250340 [compost metagenome]
MPLRSFSPPVRPSGISRRICSAPFSNSFWLIGVTKKPGQMQLTWMLCCAHLIARSRVKFTSAPLLVL